MIHLDITMTQGISFHFRAMFTGELAESRQTEVTIRDIDEMAMELLIDFCYTSHIIVEEANVQTLLPAACLLQLAEIQDICCEFLKRQLDPSNCLGIRAFADTHSCRELLRIADKFTQHNFQEVRINKTRLLFIIYTPYTLENKHHAYIIHFNRTELNIRLIGDGERGISVATCRPIGRYHLVGRTERTHGGAGV